MKGTPSGNAYADSQTVQTLERAASRHLSALVTFMLLAFGWTWALWWISAVIAPQSPGLSAPLFIISGFGPSLSGLITVAIYDGRAGLALWLARCLTWRLAPAWYLMPFFGPALAILAALGIEMMLGTPLPPSPAVGHIGASLLQFGAILFIGGPLGEEFGWRGYALPILTERCGWRWASLIVGAVWGLWHLPLFFIPGMAQAQMPMALFMASSVALSVLFVRIAVNTAFSVIPALMLHWAINAWAVVLPIVPKDGNVRPYVLVMTILFAVAVAAFLKSGPKIKPL